MVRKYTPAKLLGVYPKRNVTFKNAYLLGVGGVTFIQYYDILILHSESLLNNIEECHGYRS